MILDGHLKSALASIRSLGTKGIRVIAGAERSTAMGLHSKYAGETFTYPPPLRNRDAFVEAVCRVACDSSEPPVLYTFSDATFLPLFEAQNRLRVRAVFPGPASMTTAFGKAATMELAGRLGIATPATYFPSGLAEFDLLSRLLLYPLVLKPHRSVSWRGNHGTQNPVRFALSPQEARRKWERIVGETGQSPFLQEYIHGEELGAEFLCRGGEVLAACAHRRIRSLSPGGGASVLAETVAEAYRGIGEMGRQLVANLQWNGPMMVEFKVDRRDGRAKLIEINGRFWGSLPLAVFAGVDFPYLYYQLAAGERVLAAPPYEQGVRSRHWLGDVANLISALFGRDPLRSFAYPCRAAALREFLATATPLRSDVADRDDPAPVLMEVVDQLWRRLALRR